MSTFQFVEILTYNEDREFTYHLYENFEDAQNKQEDLRIAYFTVSAHEPSQLKDSATAHVISDDIAKALKAQYTAQYVHTDALDLICESVCRSDLYNVRNVYDCTSETQAYVYAADTEIDY